MLTRAERRSEALTELRLAAEMHQSHPAILYDLGKLALAENELEAAEAAYRALVLALHHPIEDPAQAPDRAEVYLDLAEIAAKKGDADRASDLIDSAFDAVHTGSGDAVRFEKALRDRGQNELFVRAVVRRVESESPLKNRISGLESLAEFWNAELGRAPELMKQIVRHADRLRRELERESHRELDAWLGLAAVETLLGDRDRLVRLLESAISEVGPERNRPLRIRLANSLLEDQARKDAAISLLSAILEEDPEDAQAAELLANALERDGQLELLASLLEQRFQKRRSSGVLPAGLGLQLGRVLEKLERKSEALSIYESVLAARPTDRDTWSRSANAWPPSGATGLRTVSSFARASNRKPSPRSRDACSNSENAPAIAPACCERSSSGSLPSRKTVFSGIVWSSCTRKRVTSSRWLAPSAARSKRCPAIARSCGG